MQVEINEEDKKVAIMCVEHYMAYLLDEMAAEQGEEGRDVCSPITPDTMTGALLADYETSSKLVLALENGWRLGRAKRIALKEALNRAIASNIEHQKELEAEHAADIDSRIRFVKQVSIMDALLERVLYSLNNESIDIKVRDEDGKVIGNVKMPPLAQMT